MSYDLEAIPAPTVPPAPLDLAALAARASTAAGGLPATARGSTVFSDGPGFSVERTGRTVLLSAPAARTAHDERVMEHLALCLVEPAGEVVDRHTGRHWNARLLAEWLSVAGLFSGRALAINEERIAHAQSPTAAPEFAARAASLARHAASGRASNALRERLRDELSYYATRRHVTWAVARALAVMGDFERLEVMTRAPAGDDGVDAFAVLAEYAPGSLEVFSRALGDADPNHRRAAARALHRVRDAAVLPLVALALSDKRSTVREAVLETGFDALLALPGGDGALGPALRRLESDTSSTVRKLAARWAARRT